MLTVEKVTAFIEKQLAQWPEAAARYEGLTKIKVRTFHFDHFIVNVQHNPVRIISTTARTDEKSIKLRKCFLCKENRPAEQIALPFGNDYELLLNPFPILPVHLTIPVRQHTPQAIDGRIGDMLELAKQLTPLVVFYNGPFSGASAPDHFHFQAGTKALFPVTEEWEVLPSTVIRSTSSLRMLFCSSYLRPLFMICCQDKQEGIRLFNELHAALPVKAGEWEPGMNILCWYEGDQWRIAVFPRRQHRPSLYHTDQSNGLLISPGAIDMVGLLIAPVEKDFEQITAEQVKQIYKEVGSDDLTINRVIHRLTDRDERALY